MAEDRKKKGTALSIMSKDREQTSLKESTTRIAQ